MQRISVCRSRVGVRIKVSYILAIFLTGITEDECARCQSRDIISRDTIILQSCTLILIEKAIMLIEVSIALDSRALAQFWRDALIIIPSLTTSLRTNAHLAPQYKVVERIAVEHLADFATLEIEFTVYLHQSAKYLQFDASLAHSVVWIRQTTLKHTTDTSIQHLPFCIIESETYAQFEHCIEVSIHLSLSIPTIMARLCAPTMIEVSTPSALEVAQREVETCLHSHIGKDESEVEMDKSIYLCTEHHATIHGAHHIFHTALTCSLSITSRGRLHTALASTIEELANLCRQRRELTIIRQFIAKANVSISAYLHGDYLSIEVDKRNLTALIIVRLTDV